METRIAELIAKHITGTISEQEKEQFDNWLTADPRHRRLVEEMYDGNEWRNREELLNRIDVHAAVRRFEACTYRRRGKRSIVKFLRYAAVVVPLLAAGFLLWWTNQPSNHFPEGIEPGTSKAYLYADGEPILLESGEDRLIAVTPTQNIHYSDNGLVYDRRTDNDPEIMRNKLITPRGGEFFVELSDGTRVWLNAGTTLEYPSAFGQQSREVGLSGEAFFEVQEDGRPFRVNIAGATIDVLGTDFGVSCYPEDGIVSAVLETGSIRFGTGQGETILMPGERAVALPSGEVNVAAVDVRYYTAWRHGEFLFDNAPLSEIMTILSRWYDVDFEFADLSLEKICFSGVALRSNPCDYFLRLLEQTHTVRFVQTAEKTISVEKI